LESDPHTVVEGMLIAAYAIGTSEGYIYIGDEYPLAVERVRIALKQAREYGLLGDAVLGSGFSFNVEIRRGAGAFITGEETALIESMERGRGVPRIRPPYPVYHGLWGKPTNVNNVETLANTPAIIEKGGDWYAGIGTEGSKGTKLFSLSGNITYTGVAEVPFGLPLRRLVEDIGGGIANGRKLKALHPGGAMLGLIPASLIDQPIDFEGLASIGSSVGSGGMIVIDESACLVDVAYMLMSFAYSESCGKCSIGRLGTKQMLGVLQDATNGKGQPEDMDLLTELSESLALGSFCPLCGGAADPVVSLLTYFRDELEAHIKEHHCPTGVCQELSE
jgi:NADH:ubiquinone oxidoreductase subunit F (NADH-binding)